MTGNKGAKHWFLKKKKKLIVNTTGTIYIGLQDARHKDSCILPQEPKAEVLYKVLYLDICPVHSHKDRYTKCS